MNILLPKTGKYNIGDDFPLISIPTDISGMNPVEKTFDDFQWWAESSEFKKWMDKNKRQWVADSEDMTKYTDSLSDLIKEHVGSYTFNNEINESDVLSFDEYNTINEAEEPLSNEAKAGIKFHYAYNKLKADGKLKPISSVDSDLPDGAPKAVFLVMEDPDTKQSIDETLKAYKMIGLPASSESKIKIVSVKGTLPGGPLDPDTTTSTLVEGILKNAAEYAAIGVGIGVTWAILRKLGYTVAGVSALKALRGLAPAAKTGTAVAKTGGALAKTASFAKKIGSGAFKKIKVFGRGLLDIATFKNTRNGIKSASKFIKLGGMNVAAAAGISKSRTVLRAFRVGATGIKVGEKIGLKAASRALPFVGEILLAIDVIGSTWNWFSDNQAPKWTEIKDTIATGKGGQAFDPGKINDGTAITICWRQPAGSGPGIASSFLFTNDTRTTAELFKIGKSKDGGSSIFILTSVNSKEYQQSLSNYAAVIIEIKNKEINGQSGFLNTLNRIVDNEDMDVKVAYLDKAEDMASNFNFKGICDWSIAQEYYDAASDQYLISDNDAPEIYEYYYKTSKNDYVNVSGNLLTNEEIGSKSDSDIQDMFVNFDTKINNTKPEPKENKKVEYYGKKNIEIKSPTKTSDKFKEKEQEGGTSDTQIADSENNRELWLTPMVNESAKNGMVIRKFAEFEDVLEYVVTSGKYPEYASLNEKKSNEDNLVLDAEQASEPAKIAVYAVNDIVYADPADRQYTVAAFKYFMIDPVDFNAPIDSPIGVGINTNETIVDPRRGVYEFKEKKEREEKEERKPAPEENPEQDDSGSSNTPDKPDSNDDNDDENEPNKDDYFITVDPDDISIKNRKNATVIRDKNFKGGINIVDEFLTDKQKEILGIPTWKAVTLAKSFLNGQGEVIKVKLKNRYAPMFNKAKTYEVQDGEAFQIAKKFAEEVEDRIKFQ